MIGNFKISLTREKDDSLTLEKDRSLILAYEDGSSEEIEQWYYRDGNLYIKSMSGHLPKSVHLPVHSMSAAHNDRGESEGYARSPFRIKRYAQVVNEPNLKKYCIDELNVPYIKLEIKV